MYLWSIYSESNGQYDPPTNDYEPDLQWTCLMYIRYDGKIEDRANDQQEIAGNIPTYINMKKQVEYEFSSGKFYSLLMGRKFKPDQYAIL